MCKPQRASYIWFWIPAVTVFSSEMLGKSYSFLSFCFPVAGKQMEWDYAPNSGLPEANKSADIQMEMPDLKVLTLSTAYGGAIE